MKIEVKGLLLENYKCFGSPTQLDLSTLPVGLHFVRGDNQVGSSLGSNGAGKSTLFDALCWCLYGKTVDGLRGPDLRPWRNANGKTRVGLTLERDGDLLEIVRTTPNGVLTINDKIIGQDQIDHDIMTFPVFTNTLLLGQGCPLFFDLRPDKKMDLFVDVLGLDRWDNRSRTASEELKTLLNQEVRLQAELDAAGFSLGKFVELRRLTKQQHDDWVDNRSSQAERMKAEIAKLKSEVDDLLEEKKEFESKHEELSAELQLNKERLKEHTKDLQDLENEYRRLLALQGKAKQELERLEVAQRKGLCPTCRQPVSEEHLAKHRVELNSLIEDPRIYELSDDVSAGSDLVKSTRLMVEKDTDKLHVRYQEIRYLDIQRAEASAKLEELERSLKTWSKEVNPYKDQLQTLRENISSQKKALSELSDELRKVKRRAGRVKFWVSGFKACRLYMLEEVLEELRLVSNAVCPELGLEDWEIGYAVEKENKSGTIRRGLNVTLQSPESRGAVRWESFSGGERQRLRLIGALSLSEVLLNHAGIQSDLEVLDEPTQHLSPEGTRDLCEALPSRARRLDRRTFYVDHNAVESASFATVLTVVRTKDGVELRRSG